MHGQNCRATTLPKCKLAPRCMLTWQVQRNTKPKSRGRWKASKAALNQTWFHCWHAQAPQEKTYIVTFRQNCTNVLISTLSGTSNSVRQQIRLCKEHEGRFKLMQQSAVMERCCNVLKVEIHCKTAAEAHCCYFIPCLMFSEHVPLIIIILKRSKPSTEYSFHEANTTCPVKANHTSKQYKNIQ